MRFDRVLLTGAAGRIGSSLRPALREGLAELRLSDLAPVAVEAGNEVDVPADLRDAAAVERAVDGMEGIVHLGGVPDETDFETLAGPNLHGAFHLFEAARRCDVRRVVYASSNRITGFAPAGERLRGDEAVRPDGLYGATKAYGEALGRMYADKFGLEVVCIRIGSFEERPREPRHLNTWLSPGDAARLFTACLSAPDVGFATVYGASANTRGWWDLSPARALGYEPRDDAEAFAHELNDAPDGGTDRQGGHFTEPGYGDWAV